MNMTIGDRLRAERKRKRDKKRRNWPTKRFADGSLWRLYPDTYEQCEQLEPPDPAKGWKEPM